MTVRVRLLGRPRSDAGVAPRGRKCWAVLARVALADRHLSRGELAAELFETAADPLAALRWSLAELRRALGRPDILRGDPVVLGPVEVDVLHLGDVPVAELRGDLLEGIDLRDCGDFDGWLLVARAHWAARVREELRERTLRALAIGDTAAAVDAAGCAARADSYDEPAQELYLRALIADAQPAAAAAHLAQCEQMLVREGMTVSTALRAAARARPARPPAGVRAGVAAASLLQAGSSALGAGAADGGIETLRRAEADAARAGDDTLHAAVLHALGAALVHAVRGQDGEGAVVLHRALVLARRAGDRALAADILRELAFVDVQAGRHASAARALAEATETLPADDVALTAGLLAIEGMNAADQGRHRAAVELLRRSASTAAAAQQVRQHAWSLGVLARSLLLLGRPDAAADAAEQSLRAAADARWTAFVPLPQTIRAECRAVVGDGAGARADAESAFTLAVELGDPCWEGMSARVMGLLLDQAGDHDQGRDWLVDARRRCDRVPDRYVWVSCYIGLAQVETTDDPARAVALARRLHRDARRADLPEFQAWAMAHLAAGGELDPHVARGVAAGVDNPRLHAFVDQVAQA